MMWAIAGSHREVQGRSHGGGQEGEAKFLSHQNGVSSLGFLVVGDSTIDILTLDFICLELQTIGCSIKDDKAVQIVSKPRM